jgi:hypothetical protein
LLNVQGLFGDAPECHNGEQFMSFLKSPWPDAKEEK